MPKETFFNLPKEKKERILEVLKKEFRSKPFQKVNIKSITEELEISRGSFYQYFENLEDSYFMILDMETTDIHELFRKTLIQKEKSLNSILISFGEQVADVIFQPESYMIYKNRYLYWNEDLNKNWNGRKVTRIDTFQNKESEEMMEWEKIHFIKSVIHNLIERNFQEEWSREVFLKIYRQHIVWIEKGVDYGNF